MLDELLAAPGVTEELHLAGHIGVMALHGGLEAGTAEAAAQTAAAVGASRYAIIQPADLAWHVPSIAHDPRLSDRLRSFLEHISFAVSFHGFGRPGWENAVVLGGRNRRVAGEIGAAIARRTDVRVITDRSGMPPGLTGLHPSNPVNLPEHGGVQIELSVGARRPKRLQRISEAVSSVLRAEAASVCPRP